MRLLLLLVLTLNCMARDEFHHRKLNLLSVPTEGGGNESGKEGGNEGGTDKKEDGEKNDGDKNNTNIEIQIDPRNDGIPGGDDKNDVTKEEKKEDTSDDGKKKNEVVPFGTLNGYDREGGSEPICWKTLVGDSDKGLSLPKLNDPKDAGSLTGDEEASRQFDLLMNDIYDNGRTAELYSECPNATFFRVSALHDDEHSDKPPRPKRRLRSGEHGDEDRKIFETGKPFTFSMSFNGEPKTIVKESKVSPKNIMWVRIILCNPGQVGFCSPFVDTRFEDNAMDEGMDGDRYAMLRKDEVLEGRIAQDSYHIFSRYFKIQLKENPLDKGELSTKLDVQFMVPQGSPGTYFVIADAAFFLADKKNTTMVTNRIDVAAAVKDNILIFRDPPEILRVSKAFEIALIVFLGSAFCFEGFLLYSVIRHRNHPLIRISQGKFLGLIVLCCMIATASCYFYLPRNDLFCELRTSVAFMCLQIIGAVLVGRLWRVHSILSAALQISRDSNTRKRKYILLKVFDFLSEWRNVLCINLFKCKGKEKKSRLRKSVSEGQLMCLITVLTLPQLGMQLAKWFLCPETLELNHNSEGSVAKEVCGPPCMGLRLASYAMVVAIFVVAVIMAWLSSDLPSVFNEREAIFNASWVNLFVTLSGLVLMLTMSGVTTSPNSEAFVYTATTNAIVLSTCWFVLAPKLRRVWSGEKIVVSRLLQQRDSGSTWGNRDPNSDSIANNSLEFLDASSSTLGVNIDFTKQMQSLTESSGSSGRDEVIFTSAVEYVTEAEDVPNKKDVKNSIPTTGGPGTLRIPPPPLRQHSGSLISDDDDSYAGMEHAVLQMPPGILAPKDLKGAAGTTGVSFKLSPEPSLRTITPAETIICETDTLRRSTSAGTDGSNASKQTVPVSHRSFGSKQIKRGTSNHTRGSAGTSEAGEADIPSGRSLASILQPTSLARFTTTDSQGPYRYRQLTLKASDPPPRRFEQQLMTMKTAIGSIASRSMEGRPMDLDEWEELKSQSRKLNDMLDCIMYENDS